jgi:glycosyltransferase involved in cell wall biosynthesis
MDRPWENKSLKRSFRDFVKTALGAKKCIPSKKHKIYAVDQWTRNELKKYWKMGSEEMCLYPAINVDDLSDKKSKKIKQIIIFGRIAPNKSIEDSIRIFAGGTKKYSDYKLVILGGATADTKNYINFLYKIINDLGIKNRVKIIQNPTFEIIKETLNASQILIDSQRRTSITLTSVEALSTGCILLVNKESGTYQEVLENGKYGYGFENNVEGIKKLEEIIKNLESKKMTHKNWYKRAEYYSDKNFKKRLKKVLEN